MVGGTSEKRGEGGVEKRGEVAEGKEKVLLGEEGGKEKVLLGEEGGNE